MTISIDSMTLSAFSPHIISVPSSMPSGLSCAWRIVTAGKYNIEDSAVFVPLSALSVRQKGSSRHKKYKAESATIH